MNIDYVLDNMVASMLNFLDMIMKLGLDRKMFLRNSEVCIGHVCNLLSNGSANNYEREKMREKKGKREGERACSSLQKAVLPPCSDLTPVPLWNAPPCETREQKAISRTHYKSSLYRGNARPQDF